MSNIKTLKDLERQNTGTQAFPVPDQWKNQGPQRQSMSDESYSFGGRAQAVPRYQMQYMGIDGKLYPVSNPAPLEFCCNTCCPCCVPPLCSEEKQHQYRNLVRTFTFWISVVQFILLIVALGMGGFTSAENNPSLGPPASTLVTLGAKDAKLIKEGQVWRFIVPVFLHAGILHLLFNLFAQLRFGLSLEQKWGMLKYIIIYFLSALGGVLMSCLLQPDAISVGASGALLGLMGGYLSEILLTWHKSDPRMRKINLIQAVVIVVITMLFSASKYIDASAHFGGLLIGFLLTSAIFSYEAETRTQQKYIQIFGYGLSSLFFVLGFTLFFTVVKV